MLCRRAQVRYESWEELGSLPPYNAVRVRVLSKTGDLKHALGGTPPNLRYKGNRAYKDGAKRPCCSSAPPPPPPRGLVACALS